MFWKASDVLVPLLCYSCITSCLPLLQHLTFCSEFADFLTFVLHCLFITEPQCLELGRRLATEEMAKETKTMENGI